jgi:ribosomal protein S18 acetylase RimI-like enzyme
MPPIRFLLRCCREIEHPWPAPAESREGLLTVEMCPVRGDSDLAAVAELAEECRAIDPALAGRWNPAGLCAELRGREGRRVHGWLAWPAVPEPSAARSAALSAPDSEARSPAGSVPSGDRCPLGMIAVVDVGRQPLVRASIAWLLVHPAARRRGVATALVRRALAEVGRLGGDVVSVETLPSWAAATAFWRRCAGDTECAPPCQGASHA